MDTKKVIFCKKNIEAVQHDMTESHYGYDQDWQTLMIEHDWNHNTEKHQPVGMAKNNMFYHFNWGGAHWSYWPKKGNQLKLSSSIKTSKIWFGHLFTTHRLQTIAV